MKYGYAVITFDPALVQEYGDLPVEFQIVRTETVPDLSTLQRHVGGLIEALFTIPSPFRKNVELTGYVNEEGLMMDLPVIGEIIYPAGYRQPWVGSLVMTGLRNGKTILLTAAEISYLKDAWNPDWGLLALND